MTQRLSSREAGDLAAALTLPAASGVLRNKGNHEPEVLCKAFGVRARSTPGSLRFPRSARASGCACNTGSVSQGVKCQDSGICQASEWSWGQGDKDKHQASALNPSCPPWGLFPSCRGWKAPCLRMRRALFAEGVQNPSHRRARQAGPGDQEGGQGDGLPWKSK